MYLSPLAKEGKKYANQQYRNYGKSRNMNKHPRLENYKRLSNLKIWKKNELKYQGVDWVASFEIQPYENTI